jgi:hypothetical protein
MNPEAASLDNLRDIVEPPPVPWWPPAPAWWVLFAVMVVFAVLVAFRAWHRWRADAYRRAALRELHSATTVAEIAEILKRTALCAYPRTDVAALSGSAWCQWLGQTGGQEVPHPIAEALTQCVFGKEDVGKVGDVAAFAAGWITVHAVPMADRKGPRVWGGND